MGKRRVKRRGWILEVLRVAIVEKCIRRGSLGVDQ